MSTKLLGVALLGLLQLPNLLGGDGNDVPDIKLSSGNQIVDDSSALAGRASKSIEERSPQIETERATLTDRIRRLEARNAKGDLRTARETLRLLDDELKLYEDVRTLAQDALAKAQTEPAPPTQAVLLETLLRLERSARTLRTKASLKASAAKQARERADSATAAEGSTSLSAQLALQRYRNLQALADLALARSLLAGAEALQAAQEVQARIPILVVTDQEVQEASATLAAVEREVERTRTKLVGERQRYEEELSDATHSADFPANEREPRKDLARARLEQLNHRRAAGDAQLLLAKVRHSAADSLSQKSPKLPSVLDVEPIRQELAEVSQWRLAAELQRASLTDTLLNDRTPAVRTLLQRERAVVGETLTVLNDARRDLDEALALADLTQRIATAGRRSFSRTASWLLTLLLILFGLGLWLLGHRQLMHLTADEGHVTRRLRLTAKGAAKLSIVVGIAWFLLVAAADAWFTLGAIWQEHMTFARAWALIDHPLFIVDQRGISLFSLVKFVVAVAVAVILSRLLRRILSLRVYPAFELDAGLIAALNSLIKYTFGVVGVLLGLHFIGIGLGSLAFFAGVLGIGIGFGMRNIAENFISGLMILGERPVTIGDWIDLDGEIEGQVKSIQARATRVVTRNNITVLIPNSEFVGSRVTNWSHGDPRVRVNIPVGVAYGSDTQLVRKVLREVADAHGKVLKKPAPEVQFRDFGNSSLDFALLVWIDEQMFRDRIGSDLRFAIDAAFRRNNIEIPFPQRDLHVRTMDSRFVKEVRALMNGGAPQEVPADAADADELEAEAKTEAKAKAKAAAAEEKATENKGKPDDAPKLP